MKRERPQEKKNFGVAVGLGAVALWLYFIFGLNAASADLDVTVLFARVGANRIAGVYANQSHSTPGSPAFTSPIKYAGYPSFVNCSRMLSA